MLANIIYLLLKRNVAVYVDESITQDKIAYANNTEQFILNHSRFDDNSNDNNNITFSKYTKDELLEKVYARWNELISHI